MMKLGAASAPVQAMKIFAGHVDITTYPSDPVIAPGNRFALAVNVTPAQHVHVYAPGAQGYRIVKFEMADQPYVRFLPLAYPASGSSRTVTSTWKASSQTKVTRILSISARGACQMFFR